MKSGNISGNTLENIYKNLYEKDTNYAKYYISSFGHGIGIELNELPLINKNYIKRIYQGCCVAVGANLIIPELGGIQFIDTVVLFDDGCLNLTAKNTIASHAIAQKTENKQQNNVEIKKVVQSTTPQVKTEKTNSITVVKNTTNVTVNKNTKIEIHHKPQNIKPIAVAPIVVNTKKIETTPIKNTIASHAIAQKTENKQQNNVEIKKVVQTPLQAIKPLVNLIKTTEESNSFLVKNEKDDTEYEDNVVEYKIY
jgi:hypothetical protein